jgi:hypothetical protein
MQVISVAFLPHGLEMHDSGARGLYRSSNWRHLPADSPAARPCKIVAFPSPMSVSTCATTMARAVERVGLLATVPSKTCFAGASSTAAQASAGTACWHGVAGL